MRTTLNLDDGVMQMLLRTTHATTKTQAVTQAIQDYVRRQQLEALRQLRGKLHVRRNWQHLERLELKGARRGAR